MSKLSPFILQDTFVHSDFLDAIASVPIFYLFLPACNSLKKLLFSNVVFALSKERTAKISTI